MEKKETQYLHLLVIVIVITVITMNHHEAILGKAITISPFLQASQRSRLPNPQHRMGTCCVQRGWRPVLASFAPWMRLPGLEAEDSWIQRSSWSRWNRVSLRNIPVRNFMDVSLKKNIFYCIYFRIIIDLWGRGGSHF